MAITRKESIKIGNIQEDCHFFPKIAWPKIINFEKCLQHILIFQPVFG